MQPFMISLILTGLTLSLPQESSLYRREAGMRHYGIRNIFETKEGDKYLIEKILGQGAFGVVYLASPLTSMYRRNSSKPQITIKKIRYDLWQTCSYGSECYLPLTFEDQVNDVKCEVLALRKLKQLVSEPVESADKKKIYIPATLIPGKDIHAFLRGVSTFDPSIFENIYIAAMTSLNQLHLQGVSHNDVHPGNFLITSGKGGRGKLKVTWIDFGMAKVLGDASLDPENSGCYMTKKMASEMYTKDIDNFYSRFKNLYDIEESRASVL